MTLVYLLMMTLCVGFAQADRILIQSPAKHATFQPGDTLSIDYKVRFEGMSKLGSASVSLHYANHTVLTFLPGASWTDSATGVRGANTSWTIPDDLDRGKYLLRISGPATYLCSANGNGQPPYNRCQMTIHKTRHFYVGTDDQGETPEQALQEQVEKLQELQMQVQQIQEEQEQETQEQQIQEEQVQQQVGSEEETISLVQ